MASSERPPFPREGWADPQAEQEQLQRTQQRLSEVESQHGQPPLQPVTPASDPSMVTIYGGPPIAMVPAYGGPMRQRLYGGPSRWLLRAGLMALLAAGLIALASFLLRS